MTAPTVVVGANLAGGSAAATLRQEGYDGPLVLIGAEPHPPYERPPLSKEYLRGETSLEDALLHPTAFWDQQDVETRFGVAATRIDPTERVVELADGGRVPYERLLVATGGRNRRPPIPGIDLAGVHDLRTVVDADAIRGEAVDGARVVVVGMGFIGCEVAASLRALGLEVTAVEALSQPLEAVLGETVGGALAALHRDRGVELILGDLVERFEGDGRVERVVTRSGRRLPCDMAVVGLGIEPVTDLVEGTGVEIDDGIVVDERCRTAVEGIYAAGDVANHHHPLFGRQVRVEHWQNALNQGAAAARSMLGATDPYDDVHWFWSDQYDANLQYAGFHRGWDRQILRGDLEGRRFTAFYLTGGHLDAAVSLNRPRDVRVAMRLIGARAEVDAEVLGDEGTDLRDVLDRIAG